MSNNLLDVIRFEGDNNVIVHKHSIQDFNTKSRLIVGESQEAILYKNGQALDLFVAGDHTLNTENLPLLKKMFSAIFGGRNPFQCEVFFINKVTLLDFDWGTAPPITMEDPKYHLIVDVRGNGKMGMRVNDSRKFVVKVVGQLNDFTVESIKSVTKGMAMQAIKDTIAKAIYEKGWSILELPAKLTELSADIKEKLNAYLEPFGLILDNFFVNQIEAMKDGLEKLTRAKEKYMEAMIDLDIDKAREIELGKAKAISRQAQGYTYQDERKFDVLQSAAQNEGVAGSVMGASMGVGMGFGVGGEIGKAAGQAMNSVGTVPCANCGATLPQGAKFCASCGKSTAPQVAHCAFCGAELVPGAKFCSNCGKAPTPPKECCSSCGNELIPGAKFCSKCGTPVVAKPTKGDVENKHCPFCGITLPGNAQFCHGCGKSF